MSNTPTSEPSSWLTRQLRYALNPVQFRKALVDIAEGWRRRTLWTTISLHDVRQRYRRSIIGPFWITISMGVMVAAIGILYSQILKIDTDEYLPYLSAGFVAWGLISTLVIDGCQTFISSENLIKQLSAPLSVHAYRVLWSNFLVFAHNIWIFVAVALWFNVNPGFTVLLVLPALVVVYLNGLWIALLLGLMSARFRDIPMIVGSIVQVMLFLTPIFWRPDMLPGRTVILDGNPFYHFVTIIRSPLLGLEPALENWVAVAFVTLLGWAMTLLFYTAYRWRIAYWV